MSNNSNKSFTYFNETEKIIWPSIHLVTGFLIVVVNLATIVTFVINRHLRRRSVYCLINLAVADMLIGCFLVLPTSVFIAGYSSGSGWKVYISLIAAFSKIFWLALIVSLLSLVLVSLDRVYATFLPFRHRTTRLRMYIVVFIITWLIPLIIHLTATNQINKNFVSLYTSYMVLFLFCLIIICTSYIAIFVQVKIQAKRIQLNQQQRAAIQIRQKREQHIAMTLFIVTVLSLVTWLPFISKFIMNFHFDSKNINRILLQIIYLIQHINSLINPIIYVFRMRDFRKALARLIFKCSRDQRQTPPDGYLGNNNRQQPPIELELVPQ